MVVVPCLGCSWRNARYLPAGRDQAGDRHFKFHDERDNLTSGHISRTLNLPAPVIDALKVHRARQAAERMVADDAWTETGLVFTTALGTPVDPSNFRHYFAALTVKAGLGPWHPHELRHSAASIMLAQGVPLEVVSETLGHTSIRITKDVYGHLLGAQRKHAADAMGAALWGTRDE